MLLLGLGMASFGYGQDKPALPPHMPLNMEQLQAALSSVRGPATSDQGWPRSIRYNYETHDYQTDTFREELKTFTLPRQPTRIIPHAVGVAEILWAICPPEKLIAFNNYVVDPEFCVIAPAVKQQGKLIFTDQQTEVVLGAQPDLVITVFYSAAEFEAKLAQANIPFFDVGFFGDIASIKRQTLLLGQVIGEEGNAQALVAVIDQKMQELRNAIKKTEPPKRVLYYDAGGYIPGKFSNFNSMCEMIGVVNVGAEQGIKTWAQIDYETLLKWNPDVIITPQESQLQQELLANKLLSYARAIRTKQVYPIPGLYLRITSQYMILSANVLAGIVYR